MIFESSVNQCKIFDRSNITQVIDLLSQRLIPFKDTAGGSTWLTWTNSSITFFGLGFVLGIIATNYAKYFTPTDRFGPGRRKKDTKTNNDENGMKTMPGSGSHNFGIDNRKIYSRDGKNHQVLEGAISLFSRNFSVKYRQHSFKQKDGGVDAYRKVVTYLSPEDMLQTLFFERPKDDCKNSGKFLKQSLHLNHSLGEHEKDQKMIHLFKQIQKYSVDTCHPYFFNQLFGALDPIALSAELIALSVNTSSYTFETAPVFTLIERHVIESLAKIVFGTSAVDDGCKSECYCLNRNKRGERSKLCSSGNYDGLMLPGGSLSNLTAIHLARHYCRLKSPHDKLRNTNNHPSRFESDDENQVQMDEATKSGSSKSTLVAFVSSEAHYSFSKSASVTGIGNENLIIVPTLSNGQMDVCQLDLLMTRVKEESYTRKIPFFVAATAGSTVRGSFDDLEAIARVCRKHEDHLNQGVQNEKMTTKLQHKIWMHVDGAWGGSAIFSSRDDLRQLLKGLNHVDSFTFNPHKMLGAPQQTTAFVTRHKGALKSCNSTKAKYLFDSRKNGAEFDIGDASYTCGRRTDAIKLWALWKYYGSNGLGKKIEAKVDSLALFAQIIEEHEHFMLACEPWPFNVNFFYLPKRIREILKKYNVDIYTKSPVVPTAIEGDLANVSIELKLRLHQSGEMLIPFQPISNQKADCFRLVLAGDKKFDETDIYNILYLMEKHGANL